MEHEYTCCSRMKRVTWRHARKASCACRLEEARTASGPPGESADVGTSKDPPGCPGAPLINSTVSLSKYNSLSQLSRRKSKIVENYFDIKLSIDKRMARRNLAVP